MATVTGLTAARMLEIEAASVVDGDVVGDNLILTKHDSSQINAGNVRGPVGPGVPNGGTAGQVLEKIDSTSQNTRWGTRPTQADNDARYINITGDLIERGNSVPNIAAIPGTIYLQQAVGAGGNLLPSNYFGDNPVWTLFWKWGTPLVTFPDATSTQVQSIQDQGQRIGNGSPFAIVPGTLMNWSWTFQVLSGNTDIFAELITAPAGGNPDYFGTNATTYNLYATKRFGPGIYTISGQYTIPASQVLARVYFSTNNGAAGIGPAVVRYKTAIFNAAGAAASDVGTLWVKETGTTNLGWKALSSMSTSDLLAAQDLNSIVSPGYYRVDTAAVADSLINWPVEAIPRTDKADSNNTVGSYRPAPFGLLTVTAMSQRVIQTVDIMWGGTGGLSGNGYLVGSPFVIVFKRIRGSDGTTWGPWEYCSPNFALSITSSVYGERDIFSKYILRPPARRSRTPVHATYVGASNASPPNVLDFTTIDGVQWYNATSLSRDAASGWENLTLQNSWTPYGPPTWPAPQAFRSSSGIVVTRGLLTRSPAPAINTVICNLPPGMRPAHKLKFMGNADNYTTATTVSVLPNGDIMYDSSGSGTTGYFDLNCIMFPAADVAPNSVWTPITPSTGWQDYSVAADPSWPQLGWWQDTYGRVWLRGVIRYNGAIPAGELVMFFLPAPLATQHYIHAPAPSNTAKQAVVMRWHAVTQASVETSQLRFLYNVNPTGAAYWVGLNQCYIYPKAAVPESNWRNFTMVNGWSHYDGGVTYPPISMWVAPDGIAHFRGLAKGGTAAPIAVTSAFAAGDRIVTGNLMAPIATADNFGRMDVNSSYFTLGNGNVGWVSWENIHYVVEA